MPFSVSALPNPKPLLALKGRSIFGIEIAIFAAVPEAQNENGAGRDFIAQFVIAHDNSPDLAWLIGFELFPNSRIIEEPIRRSRKLLNHTRCRVWRYWLQKCMEPDQIGGRLACPLDFHSAGRGSGLSVPRLSAHAWIA